VGSKLFLYIKFKLTSYIRGKPLLFIPLMKVYQKIFDVPHPPIFSNNTEFVLEGYWRCGNTFAINAFLMAQESDVEVAYHSHAPATVIAAVRKGVPTLVLIREPIATITSLMFKSPQVPVRYHILDYNRYYQRLIPYHDRFLIVKFEELIDDFGLVIQRVNERFGTKYKMFEHNAENTAIVFEKIKKEDLSLSKDVNKLSIPMFNKEQNKVELQERLKKEHKLLFERAQKVYQEFIQLNI
ncbi:hypothetical protein ACFLYP_03620, partial [Chloroflexota bacterium]